MEQSADSETSVFCEVMAALQLVLTIAFAILLGMGVSAGAYFVADQIPGSNTLAIYGTSVSVFAPIYFHLMVKREAAGDLASEVTRYYFDLAALFKRVATARD